MRVRCQAVGDVGKLAVAWIQHTYVPVHDRHGITYDVESDFKHIVIIE